MTEIKEEKLNKVAGGSIMETTVDAKYLRDIKLLNRKICQGDLIFNWVNCSAQVDAGWAKGGITCVTKPFASNQYFKDGKEITRDLAWLMV